MGLFNRRSLAARLTFWYGLSAFVLTMVTASVLYVSLERAIALQDHQILLEKVRTVGRIFENNSRDDVEIHKRIEEWANRHYERIYVRVLDFKARVLFQTGPADIFGAPSAQDRSSKVEAGGHIYRLESVPFEVQKFRPEIARLDIALDRTNGENLLATYRQRLAIIAIVAFGACLAIGWTLARKGVAPIEGISRTAARINSSNLSEHIRIADLPVEFSELAQTFNAMLDRLHEYVGRVSQFSEDIAHELRTPINNIIGEFEVTLHKTRNPAEYEEALNSGIEECQRISKIIESLLFVARADNPKTAIKKERFAIKAELEAIKEFYDPAAEEKGIRIEIGVIGNFEVRANKTLFQRALGNLLSNAITHTSSGGVVRIIASQTNGSVFIEVSDTGSGIEKKHLEQIFDRFYRADESRSKDSGGTGLGLAIFKSIVTLHGGTVGISSQPTRGTKVSLTIPAKP